MKFLLLTPLLFFVISCTQPNKPNKLQTTQRVCKTVAANTTILLGVKGMVCQMGCGGSIRKELKKTCAVERVELTYLDSLEEQTVRVYYDRQKLSPAQMINLLAQINDRQFTVRKLAEPIAIK